MVVSKCSARPTAITVYTPIISLRSRLRFCIFTYLLTHLFQSGKHPARPSSALRQAASGRWWRWWCRPWSHHVFDNRLETKYVKQHAMTHTCVKSRKGRVNDNKHDTIQLRELNSLSLANTALHLAKSLHSCRLPPRPAGPVAGCRAPRSGKTESPQAQRLENSIVNTEQRKVQSTM